MRLIDADKLPEVNTIERIDGEREVFANSWIPAAAIWKAPTVEAIPIEWLRERASRMLDFGEGVERIIKEWKDEQSK